MQPNTRTAIARAIELRRKLGSWEAVERAGNATSNTIGAIIRSLPDDEKRVVSKSDK
jgi:hypothetical protein